LCNDPPATPQRYEQILDRQFRRLGLSADPSAELTSMSGHLVSSWKDGLLEGMTVAMSEDSRTPSSAALDLEKNHRCLPFQSRRLDALRWHQNACFK
jgi:hypothetical protein